LCAKKKCGSSGATLLGVDGYYEKMKEILKKWPL
jgi:hypothetical protein